MFDICHEWGGDVAVSATGDLALVTGSDVTQQRVYRRLLTNPGDYLWNLSYGGGLASFVGMNTNSSNIEAVIRNQLEQEPEIAPTPVPDIFVRLENTASGNVVASIIYSETSSSMTNKISLSVTGK